LHCQIKYPKDKEELCRLVNAFSKDNVKYLNTNPYGEYSLAGSIFLDAKNHENFTDSYNLLYGHHMSHYKMFGELDRFKDEEFFKTHQTGTLTVGSKQYKLDIFAFTEVDTNTKSFFDPSNYSNQLNLIQNQNIHYKNPQNPNKILALATCKDPGTTNRTMVFCSIKE
jgi:sortase B